MIELLGAAAAFGLSGGLSPGPLLALVLTETLSYGRRAGLAVAVAPLLTDGPIIAAAVFLFRRIEDSGPALGIVSLAGGCLLGTWGVAGLRARAPVFGEAPTNARVWGSLAKGMAANFLNPSPYLFWLTVGAPLLVRAAEPGWGMAALFLGVFYLGLVGSKAVLAVLVARSRSVLGSRGYLLANRVLAAILLVYAAVFIREGLVRLTAG